MVDEIKLQKFKQIIKDIEVMGEEHIKKGTDLFPAELIANIAMVFYEGESMERMSKHLKKSEEVVNSNVIKFNRNKPPVDTL